MNTLIYHEKGSCVRRDEAAAIATILIPTAWNAVAAARSIDVDGEPAIKRMLADGAERLDTSHTPAAVGHGVTIIYAPSGRVRHVHYPADFFLT
jgi:hypothetical protein